MEPSQSTILLVEEERAVRTFLADNLTADGYDIIEAADADHAISLLESAFPDLALIDAQLRGCDGLELVAAVRGADRTASRLDPELPLIVLSEAEAGVDHLRGFERGCDDVVGKDPLDYLLLRARIAALLRRAGRRVSAGRIRVGSLELDPLGRQVWLDGAPLALSNKEFTLLRALASDPTRVFTRDELLREVWGYERITTTTRTLDSHATRLRRKLNRASGRFVVNVWGVGYRLVDGGVSALAE